MQRAQLEHAIAVLVGKPPADFSIARAADAFRRARRIPVGVPSELLERRPDIAAAERRMAAANAQIGVAQAAFFPSLTLSATAASAARASATWLSLPSRFWSIGPRRSRRRCSTAACGRRRATQAIAAYDARPSRTTARPCSTAFQEVEDNLAALRILEQEAQVQDEASGPRASR